MHYSTTPTTKHSNNTKLKEANNNTQRPKLTVERSLNHLTNFSFPARQLPSTLASNSGKKKKSIVYSEPFNKENYINAQ